MIAMEQNHFMILLFSLIGIIIFLAIRLFFQHWEVKALKEEVELLCLQIGVVKQEKKYLKGIIRGVHLCEKESQEKELEYQKKKWEEWRAE